MTIQTTQQPGPSGLQVTGEAAEGIVVQSVAGREDIERIETTVTIPPDFQYGIERSVKRNGQWTKETKVGLTADAYDYANRVIGVSFFLPEMVHDEQGRPQRNPIHRKDYIYLRLAAVWYTPLGQLVMASEDVEVDFQRVWMDSRINSRSAKPVMDEATGMITFDNFGNPAVKLEPDDEMRALKTLSQLRSFGPRYAQTVARVRLLKLATGIRSLPIDSPRPFQIKMVGYRDRLTAQQRIAQVTEDTAHLYGARDDQTKPLTQDEIDEVAQVDGEEVIDQSLMAAREAQPPAEEAPQPRQRPETIRQTEPLWGGAETIDGVPLDDPDLPK